MKTQFSFQTRQAMQVALAIAEEIDNNTKHGRPFGERREQEVRPVLLSIQGTTFRFEGGTVVRVNMIDCDQFTESWRTPHSQDWVVTHADVRYLLYHPGTHTPVEDKTSEVWGAEKLLELKEVRSWWHPHVVARESFTGRVGIFWNNGSMGHLEVDPEYNNSGFSTLVESVDYFRFVEGDLARAEKEAHQILSSYGRGK